MKMLDQPLVRSVSERCRVCYTCVRECPAKAIRISHGQAEVIARRCIGCGNCVRVCTQNAKEVLSGIESTLSVLSSGAPVAALVAPSFPAEFGAAGHRAFVGALRALGFAYVNEVAFGADLVAAAYKELIDSNPGKSYIASTCPALVSYIERYHPALVRYLAPLVSPMVASARAVRQEYGSAIRAVFIGPCIAKKAEAMSDEINGEVDAVLTFTELRNLLSNRGIDIDNVPDSDFDPPYAGLGRLFPVARGFLQTARITEDFIAGDIVCADGRDNFVEAVKEFERKTMNVRLLEILCCQGCIMGAGIGKQRTLFERRSMVSEYIRNRAGLKETPTGGFSCLDLKREFTEQDQRMSVPSNDEVVAILSRMGKNSQKDELNCGACGYDTCRAHAAAIHNGLAESEMCLPYTIEELKTTVGELACSNRELAETQEALSQSEKMAGMGQLAAGIAHEVNNPLGVVLMYAHILMEQLGVDSATGQDAAMIVEQADRCKRIVSGLLNFARQDRIVRQSVDINELVRKSMRSVNIPENISVSFVSNCAFPNAELDRDQIIQVIVNLLTNALAAMPDGGNLTVETAGTANGVEVIVIDTGVGIPKENISRIFEPFFTTKQIGKGTGLGLAVTYGIVKMHCGEIRVQSNADTSMGPSGTVFRVLLPRKGAD